VGDLSGRQSSSVVLNGITITHPDRVIWEPGRITKGELAEYYAQVAPLMLPQIVRRPLSLLRCPEGIGAECFFQRNPGQGLGPDVRPFAFRHHGKKTEYRYIEDERGLLELIQMNTVELHPWGAPIDSIDYPDRMIFDLDPAPDVGFADVVEAARDMRQQLTDVGLESFCKTTGGKGLHVVTPIEAEYEWPAIKDFAYRLVLKLEKEKPDLYVTKMTKATRKNRIYLDYLRNDRESTAVAPYSPRARAGTPVAMPLRWNELDAATAPAFHVSDFANWRSRLRHDPWTALLAAKQKLNDKMLRAAGVALRSSTP